MSIEFNCGACGKLLRVPDGSGGKQAKCPHCSAVMKVPATSQPTQPEPEDEAEDEFSDAFGDMNAGYKVAPAEDDPLGLNTIEQSSPYPASNMAPQGMASQGMGPQAGAPAPNPYAGGPAPKAAPGGGAFQAPGTQPHRGGLILTFGIVSLVTSVISFVGCCCGWAHFVFAAMFGGLALLGIGFGVPAWIMGKRDLQMIQSGSMDYAGLGTTKGGYICGILGVVFGAIYITITAFVVILATAGIIALTAGASGT